MRLGREVLKFRVRAFRDPQLALSREELVLPLGVRESLDGERRLGEEQGKWKTGSVFLH